MRIFSTVQFEPPPGFKKKIAQFMAGIKRTVAKQMQEWGVTCEEGKYPMGLPVFNRLYQLMAETVSTQNLYAK